MEITDQDIQKALIKDKDLGLKLLFNRYYKPLCVFAFKYVDDLSVSEDIVQEVFIKIWEKDIIPDNLSSYLFSSVKNSCVSYLRKQYPEYIALTDDVAFYDQKCVMDNADLKQQNLVKAIENLPEKSREVFKAVVLSDMKYKEVADEFNISVNTVKSNLARSFRLLREILHVFIFLISCVIYN